MTHADKPYPAVALTISIGGYVASMLAQWEPAIKAGMELITACSGLAALVWYIVSTYYKIKNKGKV